MKVIFGLGNPGIRYINNRHNLGYMVLDAAARAVKSNFKSKILLRGNIARARINNEELLLVKPRTYMNNSGVCAKKTLAHYCLSCNDSLIVYDDIDISLGTLRFREIGSSGGHKGLQSIVSELKDDRINRLRVGVSRSNKMEASDYVLSDFLPDEKKYLSIVIEQAVNACFDWIKYGGRYVMTHYNKNFIS